ncbi:MAG: hypothetical protein WCS97_01140 [Candidatus Paceibacterota bacterium]|jgi:hypothetical protein
MNKRLALTLVLLATLVFVVGIRQEEWLQIPTAHAGAGQNVSGYAWSDTVGWISFNNISDGSAVDYGVNINASTGNFSGYAWSDNIGWISFNETSGCPESGCTTQPNLNTSTGAVTGWAKALSANGSGWDGWIKLSGPWSPSVTFTANAAAGYSWGSDVVGWISWSGSGYGVVAEAMACVNGANNYPTCNTCADPLFWNESSCVTCFEGCTSGACSNGATNPPACDVFLPTASLLVNGAGAATIDNGQSATLTWSSTNATYCIFANDPMTHVAAANSTGVSVSPSATSAYSITCYSSDDTPSSPSNVTVTVTQPNVSISANPMRVPSGSTSKITWTSLEVLSCAVTQNGTAWKNGLSGTDIVSDPITGRTVFTITCQTNGSPVSKSVTVNLPSSFQEF